MNPKRRFLLDTNILSDLVRNPQGAVTDHILKEGEGSICTSIVVTANQNEFHRVPGLAVENWLK
jgi:predicted nucleic acid-binding protein